MIEGNRIYLVCEAHPDAANGLMLGMRRSKDYGRCPQGLDVQKWFDKHAACCEGKPDHYRLAHEKPLNWDCQPIDATTNIPLAVKLQLVKQ